MKYSLRFLLLISTLFLSVVPVQAFVLTQTSITSAIANHSEKVRVEAEAVVIKILPDDTHGTRHQKFLVRLPTGESLLIAHNIDIAGRVDNLKISDTIIFSGEYVWNEKGGVVHWTHHDPSGKHPAGWLKHKGVTYQ